MIPEDVLGSVETSLGAEASVAEHLAAFRKSLLHHLLRKGMYGERLASGPLGELPASWEVKTLGEVASLTSGKAKPKNLSPSRSLSCSVPVYGGNGLLGFTATALRTGSTVVVGRIGARCGAVHFVPDETCWVTDNALFVYATRTQIDLRFLYYSLCYADLASLRNAGRQPVISLGTIYPLLIAVPPLGEQRWIVEVLRSLEALVDAQRKVLDQVKRLRTAVLAAQ